jgi:hypothetical protein
VDIFARGKSSTIDPQARRPFVKPFLALQTIEKQYKSGLLQAIHTLYSHNIASLETTSERTSATCDSASNVKLS